MDDLQVYKECLQYMDTDLFQEDLLCYRQIAVRYRLRTIAAIRAGVHRGTQTITGATGSSSLTAINYGLSISVRGRSKSSKPYRSAREYLKHFSIVNRTRVNPEAQEKACYMIVTRAEVRSRFSGHRVRIGIVKRRRVTRYKFCSSCPMRTASSEGVTTTHAHLHSTEIPEAEGI